MKFALKNKVSTALSLIAVCAALASCAGTPVVNNCPSWVEVGTISLDDTEETKRWMFRFEKNRVRECK